MGSRRWLLFSPKRAVDTDGDAYLSMGGASGGSSTRNTPLMAAAASSSVSPSGSLVTASAAPPRTRRSLRKRLENMLFGRRAGAYVSGASGVDSDLMFEAERVRWRNERQLLMEDSIGVRRMADEAERSLGSWSGMAHDLLFYGLIYGRHAYWTERLSAHLRRSLAEVEGVLELEITELRLPQSSEHAPRLKLLKYAGPELSEWAVAWEPPPAQAGASITLRGRRFGVSFTVVVAVGAIRLHGLLVCRYDPTAELPALIVGFKKAPSATFDDVSIAGKALSLGSETLRSWLHTQMERAMRDHLVLPR